MPQRPKAKDHLALNITGLEPTVPDIYPLAFWSPPVGYGKAQEMGKWEPGSLPHPVSQLLPSLEPQDGPSSLGCKWFAPEPAWRVSASAETQKQLWVIQKSSGRRKVSDIT